MVVAVSAVGARVEEADVAAAEEDEEARVQRDDDDLLRGCESVTARHRGGKRRERGTHESRRSRDKEGELSRARARLEPAQAARINHVVDGRDCDARHEGDDEDGRRRDRERPGALELGRDLGERMNEGDIGRRGDDERPARVGDDAGLICGREGGSASCSSGLERLRERERERGGNAQTKPLPLQAGELVRYGLPLSCSAEPIKDVTPCVKSASAIRAGERGGGGEEERKRESATSSRLSLRNDGVKEDAPVRPRPRMSFWRRWLRWAERSQPTAMAAPPSALNADSASEVPLAHVGVLATGAAMKELRAVPRRRGAAPRGRASGGRKGRVGGRPLGERRGGRRRAAQAGDTAHTLCWWPGLPVCVERAQQSAEVGEETKGQRSFSPSGRARRALGVRSRACLDRKVCALLAPR